MRTLPFEGWQAAALWVLAFPGAQSPPFVDLVQSAPVLGSRLGLVMLRTSSTSPRGAAPVLKWPVTQ